MTSAFVDVSTLAMPVLSRSAYMQAISTPLPLECARVMNRHHSPRRAFASPFRTLSLRFSLRQIHLLYTHSRAVVGHLDDPAVDQSAQPSGCQLCALAAARCAIVVIA